MWGLGKGDAVFGMRSRKSEWTMRLHQFSEAMIFKDYYFLPCMDQRAWEVFFSESRAKGSAVEKGRFHNQAFLDEEIYLKTEPISVIFILLYHFKPTC